MEWQPIVGLGFAALGVAMGVGFRLGHFPTAKRRPGWYHEIYVNDALGRWPRNYLYAAIPWGLCFGFGTVAALVAPSPDEANAAEIVLMLAAFVSFIVGIVFIYTQPRLLKPRWLRDVEEGRAPVPHETPPPSAWAIRMTWLLLAAGAVAAWRFGELTHAIGPLFIGASYAAAATARRQRRSRP